MRQRSYFHAKESAANELYKHIREKYRRLKNVALIRKVIGEVEPHPSGLVLPGGKVIKRFDSIRVERVIWKIVRGLYFDHSGNVLPEKLAVTWTLTGPDDGPPPDHFLRFTGMPDNPSYGKHPGVFAYQFQVFREMQPYGHYWALLLWDKLIITVAFAHSG